MLQAQLALASAEIGMFPDAAKEAAKPSASTASPPTPTASSPPPLRKRLESQLPGWETASPGTPVRPLKRKSVYSRIIA